MEEEVKPSTEIEKKKREPPTKCLECKQILDDDLVMYAGDPEDAVSYESKNFMLRLTLRVQILFKECVLLDASLGLRAKCGIISLA